MMQFSWARRSQPAGYECSTKGDARFSAFNAKMPDGRSIEEWYQCDLKGHDPGGTNWKLGKGKPPLLDYKGDELWMAYLTLWRIWAIHNSDLMVELANLALAKGSVLTDCFASTPINQARALSKILTDWVLPDLNGDTE